MGLRVIAYANGRMTDLDGRVKSVSVRGTTTTAVRTASIEVLNASTLRERVLNFESGRELRVLYKDEEIFRGIIVANGISTDGNAVLEAKDYNFYLVRNFDSVAFENKRADQIVTELCGKFGIPTGDIQNTGYVIPKLITRGKSLYEIMVKGLKDTQDMTGRRFRIRNTGGKVELYEMDKTVIKAVLIENARNLIAATYRESIDDIYTQVKLVGGSEKKPVTAVAKSPLASKYGVIQYYENVNDVKRAPKLQADADTLLATYSKPKQEVSVDALGNVFARAGTAVAINDAMTGLSGTFSVVSDEHKFGADNTYTMRLNLVRWADRE